MKKSTYTDDQIVLILQEAHKAKIPELAKRRGVSKQNGLSWLDIGTHKTLLNTVSSLLFLVRPKTISEIV